jgi:hypothetical protein
MYSYAFTFKDLSKGCVTRISTSSDCRLTLVQLFSPYIPSDAYDDDIRSMNFTLLSGSQHILKALGARRFR